MTTEGAAARIYRRYNDAENARDQETMAALLDPAIAVEMNGKPAISSADEDAEAMAGLFDAYPDYHREIVAIVDGGETAAVRWRMLGTPAPSLADRLPALDLHGCSFVTVRDGRMTEAWLYGAEGVLTGLLKLAARAG